MKLCYMEHTQHKVMCKYFTTQECLMSLNGYNDLCNTWRNILSKKAFQAFDLLKDSLIKSKTFINKLMFVPVSMPTHRNTT